MIIELPYVNDFREKLAQRPREEIIDVIRSQNPSLVKQVNRIEHVFRHKLRHLTDANGDPIEERDLTNEELALLVDVPFRYDKALAEQGFTEEDQRKVHVASDPVVWAREFLGADPRAYQILALRWTSNRKVLRWGRRAGKTYCMAILLLHYALNVPDGRCLVMAPMKSQVGLIYEEALKLVEGDQSKVKKALGRHVTSPQFEMAFSTGSTIRFFTTGMASGGKSDVARGQEAHVIVLDEMDYMGADDLTALLAMLQTTGDNQPTKTLIAASTPTGRREKFWEWCTKSKYFKEFYFPSYCNPHFDKEIEEQFRDEYTEMGYRHEIEADWGEDAEGVYPKKYVDRAFVSPAWSYMDARRSARSNYLIGVDWDKYGAGPNICVLEVCFPDYEEERFASRIRVAYRQEIPRSEYVLTDTVDRIIELNNRFQPSHIYVDRGMGETQVELLGKYGLENPSSKIKERLKGWAFGENIEVKDPTTREIVKKPLKAFMVDNLRNLLERDSIVFPGDDDQLYEQLLAYVVVRQTESGKPVFAASGTQVDHAHDALILAALAYTLNYDDLFKRAKAATKAMTVSNQFFMGPTETPSRPKVPLPNEKKSDDKETVEAVQKGPRTGPRTGVRTRAIRRRSF